MSVLPDGSHQKQVAATHLLDKVQARQCRDNVDCVGDDLNYEGVLEASVLEVLSSILISMLVKAPTTRQTSKDNGNIRRR